MADIRLVRVDFRLMHGQVIANWVNQVDANAILIINEQLANDKFMQNVYKMAAPKGIRVSIMNLEKAMDRIQSEKWKDRRLFYLNLLQMPKLHLIKDSL